jgi:hypothetical protein
VQEALGAIFLLYAPLGSHGVEIDEKKAEKEEGDHTQGITA